MRILNLCLDFERTHDTPYSAIAGELWLILCEFAIYASVNRDSIGSDNGLSPIRHQAII